MKTIKDFFANKNKEEHNLSFQEWLGIEKINKNRIYFYNNRSVLVYKVLPINFKLKSHLEQQAIYAAYKNFLKNINSKIQLIISSRKTDISYHTNEILKITNENPNLSQMSQDYISLINEIINEKGTIMKEFYIVLEYGSNTENEVMKISEYLSICGNEVVQIDEDEVKRLIQNYTNKRLYNTI